MIRPTVYRLDADATAGVFRAMGRRIRKIQETPAPAPWWRRALAWWDQVWL